MPSGYGKGGYGQGGYGESSGSGPTPAHYQSLITSEYQQSPNLLAWLAAPLGVLDDAVLCLAYFATQFDLASAVGVQLDILGQLIGRSRTVAFQPSGSISPVLDDTTYRLLLQATIAWNQWDGKIGSLQSIWAQLFPGGRIVVEDGQNMTVTVLLTGVFSSIIVDLITNGYIVPRPEGVLYNYVFSTLPVFGFDQSNSYIAGFDQGHWS